VQAKRRILSGSVRFNNSKSTTTRSAGGELPRAYSNGVTQRLGVLPYPAVPRHHGDDWGGSPSSSAVARCNVSARTTATGFIRTFGLWSSIVSSSPSRASRLRFAQRMLTPRSFRYTLSPVGEAEYEHGAMDGSGRGSTSPLTADISRPDALLTPQGEPGIPAAGERLLREASTHERTLIAFGQFSEPRTSSTLLPPSVRSPGDPCARGEFGD
jgi:hypothetical protein